MLFKARQFQFTFPRPALIMGVLNVTPDSFSDGGIFLDPGTAVRRGIQLVEEGADIVDIGGESTRPNAEPVEEQEELRRVMPVIEKLAGQVKVPLSIDTMKPAVARRALQNGVSIVNDVAANRQDPQMWHMIAEAGAGYVVMHMQGTPQTMQHHPTYRDVVSEVGEFFSDRLKRLNASGVSADQVVLDVGIGFGKTADHNLQLLAALESFRRWERPLLLGVSRKSFMGQVAGMAGASERLPGSLACACWAVKAGVNIIRTHDVAPTRQALRMTEAILARRKS